MSYNGENNNINNNSNNPVNALLELRRAQQNSFGSYYKFIESEIQKIKQSANINYYSLSESSNSNYLTWAAWYFPPVSVQTAFLFFWLISLLLFYKIFRSGKFVIKYLIIFFITSLLGLFLVLCLRERKLNFGIVKQESQLKLGPDIKHISRKDLRPLEEVKIISKFGDWYKVEADSIIGWIQNTDLELVNNNEF